jgi:hypothetical protein
MFALMLYLLLTHADVHRAIVCALWFSAAEKSKLKCYRAAGSGEKSKIVMPAINYSYVGSLA